MRTDPNVALRAQQLLRMRFDYVFDEAWYSIAVERGWRIDSFLQTASRPVIMNRLRLSAKGL